MIRLTSPCTIKVPVDCVIQIDPRNDQTGYMVQIIKEESGEIVFHGYFGITPPPTKEGKALLDELLNL